MNKVKYRNESNARWEEDGTYFTDIEEAINGVRSLLFNGREVEFSLMPGDATNYLVVLSWFDEARHFLKVQYVNGDWTVIIPSFMSPCFLKQHVGDNLSPWTATLVCDVANRICGSVTSEKGSQFYDWINHVPHYIVRGETTPAGWESADAGIGCPDE